MTVELHVRAVRDALWTRSLREGGERSNSLLGMLFHEVAEGLTGRKSAAHVVELFEDGPTDREARAVYVRRAVYERLVGPRLSSLQAQLGASGAEVLSFWTGVQELTDWLIRLCETAVEQGRPLDEIRALFASEEPLRVKLRDARWTDDVEVSGVLDLVLRLPEKWCLIELKLGRGALEADLGQASLYHLLLSEEGRAQGSLALVSFDPRRNERLLSPEDLARVRGPLLDLVGRLAGVLAPTTRGTSAAIPKATPAPAAPNAQLIELTRKLTSAFREYGVEVKLGEPIAGATFYRFPVELGRGQNVSKLRANTANVQLRVGLKEPPLVNVERGRLMLDVERSDRQLVPFASVRAQIMETRQPAKGALLPIGVDHAGNLRFADLGDALNCHVLVAGTTGSGKSEWLRFALAGLALRSSPEDVKLVLIDPKRTAFGELRGSPYLYGDRGLIFPDEHPVAEVLAELGDEMDRRYALFSAAGADDLASYIAKTKHKLPRILVVCDEYYDLVGAGGRAQKDIESAIARLGAKARAAGIHLLLATQQPSREVMRGVIQTNMPCRVGLKTQKSIESKMLLNESGAEALLGHGDLLFKDVGSPVRLQSPLTTTEDRRAIFHPA